MKKRIDNILLGLLWLVAVTLVASFWFNTIFGFNIFSIHHWEYLAYLQAAKSPINYTFYVSMIVIVFIALFGFYAILRPKLRKMKLTQIYKKKKKDTKSEIGQESNKSMGDNINSDASTLDILTSEHQYAPVQKTPVAPVSMRPPRLNLPTLNNNNFISTQKSTQGQENTMNTEKTPIQDYPEIQEIFSNAGYVVKPSPYINGTKIALFAIGTDENLWIGAVGIKTTNLRTIIERLSQIFSDTLDDIYININGFVISAPDAATSENEDILMFNTISELREYMKNVPNPPVSSDDKGDFDAYSEYIDTVLKYIGKI